MHTGLMISSRQRNDDHTYVWVVWGSTRIGVWYLSSSTTDDDKSLFGNIMEGDHLLSWPC